MENMKKQILIGEESFEKMIDGNYFYVDKSLFINEIEKRHNNNLCINGETYFMKHGKKYPLDCYTEHIASTFIRECGYSAQQTMMGIYENLPVVLCKDFTNEYGLVETFDKTSPFRLNIENWIYEYDIDYLIDYFKKLKNCNVEDCVMKLWEMCLFDILLDIGDRHCGNVGFCHKNSIRTFSPLFDNAESLFPYIDIEDNFIKHSPERIITHDFAYCWFASKHKNECPSDLFNKFQEIDVVSAMDRSTVGFKEIWRSFYRSIVYYRQKCLIKGDEFVWEGMK